MTSRKDQTIRFKAKTSLSTPMFQALATPSTMKTHIAQVLMIPKSLIKPLIRLTFTPLELPFPKVKLWRNSLNPG